MDFSFVVLFNGFSLSFPEPLMLMLVGAALILLPLVVRRWRNQNLTTRKKIHDTLTGQPTKAAK